MKKLERNQYLETDGLFWESPTHEWFNDKGMTDYAQRENSRGIALPNLTAFVVRNKETGDYDRVLMDNVKNEVVFDTKGLEDMGVKIDQLKLLKDFG
jgi:hypothetical protein